MWIYIITFIACIFVDSFYGQHTFLVRKILLLWLYIFLCFGYTVGTDWRNYEDLYTAASDDLLLNRIYEQGFYYIVYILRQFLTDYWLFVGILKCIYLYGVIRLVRRFTDKIFWVLAILMNYNLLFMLVDNPLRFMVASIFLIFSIDAILSKKYKKLLLIGVAGTFFHISIVLCFLVVISPLALKKITKWPNSKLWLLYAFTCVIGAFPSVLNSFGGLIAVYLPFLANKVENTYFVESISPMFTIGSLIMFFLFFIVLKYKESIIRAPHGDLLFYYTLIYMYLFRLLIIVPTGFRINIFFSIFFVIGLVYIISKRRPLLRLGIFGLLIITISKNLWDSYQFIPYTNSIYYIVTQSHLPRSQREDLNKAYYFQRTGKRVEERKFEIRN